MRLVTNSPEETFSLGESFARLAKDGAVFCLSGDLGAGKTLLVQGMASGLGARQPVTSPTFNLMNIYDTASISIYHFDLYRLDEAEQLTDIGFYEYVSQERALIVIEWPDKFRDDLPDDFIWLNIGRLSDDNSREIVVELTGGKYRRVYEGMKDLCQS